MNSSEELLNYIIKHKIENHISELFDIYSRYIENNISEDLISINYCNNMVNTNNDDKEYSIFTNIETAIRTIKEGKMIIVMDDEDRENEGDIIMAAECVTAAQCALIIRHSTGILCAPMTAERASKLELPHMVKTNQDINKTAFTITCDSIHTTTGVSAADRTRTFHDLANSLCNASDFNRPGHVFPLIAKSGGVRERRGHTEAGVDICKMAGMSPVALISELCNDDGTMMRLTDCARFAKCNNIPLITINAMVKYLDKQETSKFIPPIYNPSTQVKTIDKTLINIFNKVGCLPIPLLYMINAKFNAPMSQIIIKHIVWPKSTIKPTDIGTNIDFIASTILPTSRGQLKVFAYRNRITRAEPIVLQVGNVAGKTSLPVRVHDQCITSEVFGSLRCDCCQQLYYALNNIYANKCGAIIYLPQEGRGIGLANKIAAYSLQDIGLDTVDANLQLGLPIDARQYDCIGSILKHLEIKTIALITNNPQKLDCLKKAGIKVTMRIPCIVPEETVSKYCRQYINTKIKRMGHLFTSI